MPGFATSRPVLLRAALAAVFGVVGAAGAAELPLLVLPNEGTSGALDSADTRVLPVWSNESGRVEALLLLDSRESGLNPLDRLLGGDTVAPGLGARLSLADGSRVSTALQFDPDAGLALLCNGSIGLAASLGTFGQDCLLASLGDNDVLLRGTAPGLRFGGDWRSADGGVDLDFGLSWLDTSFSSPLTGMPDAPTAAWSGIAMPSAPWNGGFGELVGARLDARQLHLGATLNFTPQRWMSLAGNLATQRFTPAGTGLPLHWETATVTLGVGYRGITGQITGRLLELPSRDATWSGLDLGVSWRTPWQAELTVGARNVLGSGPDPRTWPLAELPALEDPAARVPYVRYRQDL